MWTEDTRSLGCWQGCGRKTNDLSKGGVGLGKNSKNKRVKNTRSLESERLVVVVREEIQSFRLSVKGILEVVQGIRFCWGQLGGVCFSLCVSEVVRNSFLREKQPNCKIAYYLIFHGCISIFHLQSSSSVNSYVLFG